MTRRDRPMVTHGDGDPPPPKSLGILGPGDPRPPSFFSSQLRDPPFVTQGDVTQSYLPLKAFKHILRGAMIMAAPKPRPAGLKLIEGRGNGRDSGGRPVKQVPGFVRLPPEAPEWLPAEARAEWERVVPELSRLQLTKPVDRAALTAYCLTWDRLVRAQRTLEDDGGSVLSRNSQGVVRHPAVAVIEAASKDLRAWCAEFGFTPSAEQKVAGKDSDDGDEENPFA